MFLFSHQSIPEAKGICPQIAKLFLWNDNHKILNKTLVVPKTRFLKLYKNNSNLQKEKNFLKNLLFISLILQITIISLLLISRNSLINTIKTQKEKLNSLQLLLQDQKILTSEMKITDEIQKKLGGNQIVLEIKELLEKQNQQLCNRIQHVE